MKTEQCCICKRMINLSIEHYLILDEFKGNKKLAKTYYHKECFAEKMLVQRQMKNVLGGLNNLIGGVKDKFEIENKKEEYIVG